MRYLHWNFLAELSGSSLLQSHHGVLEYRVFHTASYMQIYLHQGPGTATSTYGASIASTNHPAHGGGRGSWGSQGVPEVPGGLRGPGVSGVHCSWGLRYWLRRARCPCLVPDANKFACKMQYGIPCTPRLHGDSAIMNSHSAQQGNSNVDIS